MVTQEEILLQNKNFGHNKMPCASASKIANLDYQLIFNNDDDNDSQKDKYDNSKENKN